ncbi:MAG: YiiX/YebB-like N1pC/P60 family cysteine hydrolase [Gammaproteobacteria bacterium]|nr:YiiX/YebB-like N1pC/P60 family cysteine hydrolase [Gammaproteobacteria bacterium]MDH3467807.1 YiiX/YebB-like N1pC/P60 family cysteine hydrolase [Gammaproteobacteria bacterium]
MLNAIRLYFGRVLARYLTKTIPYYRPFSVHDTSILRATLRPGDILLVEGNTRISKAIKYLTQSTWSHSAMYVGSIPAIANRPAVADALIEAELRQGVNAVPLSKYRQFNTRICRPVGLTDTDRQSVCNFMTHSIGKSYDLKNVTDLLRYLFPTPPVPVSLRRRMLALGSGDPTRAICSTLIAQAFQSIRYPILPKIERHTEIQQHSYAERELLHIRHYSLFAPRDFDISPYFEVVKPTLKKGFNYKDLTWARDYFSDSQTM